LAVVRDSEKLTVKLESNFSLIGIATEPVQE